MRVPGFEWLAPIPASNYSTTGARPIVGLQVHHADGSLASANGVFQTPGSERSAHVGIDYDGSGVQWVDTAHVAYAGCLANWTGYLSAECASDPAAPDAPPTSAQIVTLANLAVWAGIPAQAVEFMGGPGIGYHRQFPGACGSSWGQTACPGDGFVAKIPAIIAAMHGPPPPDESDDGMTLFLTKDHGVETYHRDASGLLVAMPPEEVGAYYPGIVQGWVHVVDLGGPLGAVAYSLRSIAALKQAGVIK